MPQKFNPASLCITAISTILAYSLAYLASDHFYSVAILPIGITRDFPLVLALSALLFSLSRNVWTFVSLQWLIIAIFYIGNAAKLAFFGGPLVPDDIYGLRSLLFVLTGWQFLLVTASFAGLAGLMLYNFDFRRRRAWLALGSTLTLTMITASHPRPIVTTLDTWFGNSVWDQRANYLHKGATLYSLQETARFFQEQEPAPGQEQILLATSVLFADPSTNAHSISKKQRNVYLILLESFWDPQLLKDISFNTDPLGSPFRQMWQSTGNSTIMSPVFGGYTANAEFESLCGFPVTGDDIKFERWMRNPAPCLPAVLKANGYETVASHPNIPSFWNRVNAYKRVGFQTYWSIKDFDLDDMNLFFLSDISLYQQVLKKQTQPAELKAGGFNYIVTYSGHWAGPELYPSSESRPPVIHCLDRCETPEIESYANAIYYKAQEFMTFLDQIHHDDPDALVVAFGDHLPYLGENFQGYVEGGILADTRDQFTPEMLLTSVSTPLIVIDGQRGPLNMGNLPLYQLPGRILEILNIDEPTIMGYAETAPVSRVRPLNGMNLIHADSGETEICKEPGTSAECDSSSEWLKQLLTLSVDLFQGRQHVLPHLAASHIATMTPHEDQEPTESIQ